MTTQNVGRLLIPGASSNERLPAAMTLTRRSPEGFRTKYQAEICGGCGTTVLACPFPACIEEDPRAMTKSRLALRAAEWRKHCEDGHTTAEIAVKYGVTRRTVQREINRA